MTQEENDKLVRDKYISCIAHDGQLLTGLVKQAMYDLVDEAQSKFIPVENQLPEPNVWVLCYNPTNTFHYKDGFIVGQYVPTSPGDEGSYGWMGPNGYIADPTHWQELNFNKI